MSIHLFSNGTKTSEFSSLSQKTRKSLTEKIRELGVNLKSGTPLMSTQKLQHIDLKVADTRMTRISLMIPNLNLEQLIYYQPELIQGESSSSKNVYKITKFETKSTGPKEVRRISDIEVKSFKPTKKMKFRRKKRRSSIISRVEEILNRGKGIALKRDESEETIVMNYYEHEKLPKKINDLPESILQNIFFWVPQKERALVLSRVCKLWYYILRDPIFWQELEFTGDRVPASTISELLHRYPAVEKLKLTSVPDAVEILQELCRCNHGLKWLIVRGCKISPIDFNRIILLVVSCCKNMEVLDIKGMQFQSDWFYVELGRLPNLKSLNLSGNKLLRSQDLITLSVNCRALQDLRILDINSDSSMGTTLRDNDLVFITTHLQHNLITLKIDMHQLGNISYQAILKCSLLRCLALKNCLLLSSDVFRQFPVLKNLKKLKITRAINIKSEDFQFVFSNESMRNIENLDLNGCWNVGEPGLRTITSKLMLLQFLSLKNCKSIRKDDLPLLLSCSKLVGLNMAHIDADSNSLIPFLQFLKNLQEVVIGSDVSPKSLRLLKRSFPSLMIKLSFSEYQKDERILQV